MTHFSSEKRSYWERRLRNLLLPIPLDELLVMSWAIEAFRDGSLEARRYIDFPGQPDDHKINGMYFIAPWSIDSVIREKLALGLTHEATKRLNLRAWNGVTKLMNIHLNLSNTESVMDYSPNDILSAMPRVFWPQYDWQLGTANLRRLGRAWHVYASDEGKATFFNRNEIDLETFLKVSFGIYAASADHPIVRFNFMESQGITSRQIEQVSRVLGGSFASQRERVQITHNPNIPRDFLPSITKEKPLFEVNRNGSRLFYIPSRSNLLLRVTDGLYYDLVSDPNARRRSGERFEDLCIRVTRQFLGADWSVRPEQPTSYGMSADILIEHEESATGIVIECKARRIPRRVLISPDPFQDCADAFNDMIDGITRVWRTHYDLYRSRELNMTGIVLQYDPWTTMGRALIHRLFRAAHEQANDLGIPNSSRIPVAFVGYFDFERSFKDYSYFDIFRALRSWDEDEFQGWSLSSALNNHGGAKAHGTPFDYEALIKLAVSWWD